MKNDDFDVNDDGGISSDMFVTVSEGSSSFFMDSGNLHSFGKAVKED